MSITEKTANRLIHETSPYLLQHAYNPVDWYPWGEEAFARAKSENKPVLLSVGYSTCHWCHVMEQESFEDEEVAKLLNRDFISIKVDKEERPDIDTVYMEVTQAMTGSGGWPMTVFLTPDQKPFFSGTYFPKTSRHRRAGFIDILQTIAEQWKADRLRIESAGDEILTRIKHTRVQSESAEPEKGFITAAYRYFIAAFDEHNGGFNRAPKFPSPHNLMFLMRYGVLESEQQAFVMVEKTLQQMYRGGIYDHVGGGFSRYSTDANWLVPHFEKMLYDNALLTIAYLDAYQINGRDTYRRVAENILSYIAREMTGELGQFYCAQDADSEGHEGLYYVWRPDEITQILGEDDGRYWNKWFGLTKHGNFEGQNIPNLLQNVDYADENERIEVLNEKIYNHRLTRVKLHKDDKALTSWNSMMIIACAKAYAFLDEPKYLTMATRAKSFISEKLTDKSGGLHVSYRNGHASGEGYLDDYAFYAMALLELYSASFDSAYLAEAIDYAERMHSLFADERDGGYFLYSNNAESLITRPKETYDGATPSGNSVTALVLQWLSDLTGEPRWDERARRQIEFMTAETRDNPAVHCFSNIAMMSVLYPRQLIVCVAAAAEDATRLRRILARRFSPDLDVVLITPENEEHFRKILPWLRDYRTINDETAFYVCKDRTCSMPFTGFDKLDDVLCHYSAVRAED